GRGLAAKTSGRFPRHGRAPARTRPLLRGTRGSAAGHRPAQGVRGTAAPRQGTPEDPEMRLLLHQVAGRRYMFRFFSATCLLPGLAAAVGLAQNSGPGDPVPPTVAGAQEESGTKQDRSNEVEALRQEVKALKKRLAALERELRELKF